MNKPISTIEHYGDLSCSTLRCDNLRARCITVGDTDKTLLHNNLEIVGNARIDGILFNYNNIYDFRVDDLIYSSGNIPNQLSDSFVYINDGLVIANSINGTTTGGWTNRRILYLPDAHFDEKVDKIFSNRRRMFVITNTGKVFAIGNNDNCSLGIDGVTSASVNQFTRAFTRDANGNDLTNVQFSKIIITGINCRTTYALSVDGNLYACGENSNGQLANGTTTSTNSTTLKCPNRVDFSGVGIASGIVKDAIMGGETWSFINNASNMSAATGIHSVTLVVVTKNNEVWAAGYGNLGQNGQGRRNVDTLTRLVKVKVSNSENLTDVSSIHVYSAFEPIRTSYQYSYGGQYIYGFIAITNSGKLYQWGIACGVWNSDIGYSPITVNWRKEPSPNLFATNIPITNDDKTIKRIWISNSCMKTGLYIQTTDDLVYSVVMESNDKFKIVFNQFFNNTTTILDNIYIISGYISDRVSLFAITHNNTTMKYTLWAIGYNKYGQLGLGNRDNIWTMTNTGIDSKYVQNIRSITGMNYDRYYTCILLNDGHVFHAGEKFPLDGSSDVKPTFRLLS